MSSEEMLNAAQEDPRIAADEIVFVDRDTKLDTNTVHGTQTFYHVRGEAKIAGDGERYSLHSSTIPCACDLCLKGGFRRCGYLAKQGNVRSHLSNKNEPGLNSNMTKTVKYFVIF